MLTVMMLAITLVVLTLAILGAVALMMLPTVTT